MNKPNVVIIMTDQQRADVSRREGFEIDTTPFLDSLARQGVWFDHAYTSMPVCAPARVSMLTGRYPGATRVRTNWNIEDACYKEDLFEVFRRNGYKTALCGKNHSHLTQEKTDFWFACSHLGIYGDSLTQQEKAFNEFIKETHFHISEKPTPFPLECQIPYRLVSRAHDWIGSLGNQSFLLWLSFPEPHNPYQVPEPYFSMFSADCPPPSTNESTLKIKGSKYRFAAYPIHLINTAYFYGACFRNGTIHKRDCDLPEAVRIRKRQILVPPAILPRVRSFFRLQRGMPQVPIYENA